MVDIHTLSVRIRDFGVEVNGKRLTNAFLDGLYSLDGIHPTTTGYAIIANEFIKTMNRQLDTNIPPISIEQVAKTDPLVFASVEATNKGHVDAKTATSMKATILHPGPH